MESRIPQEELNNHLWNAAVLLRTYIDAGSYKQYIFPLLFFKRLSDVYDEETAEALEASGGDAEFRSPSREPQLRNPGRRPLVRYP